MGRIQSNVGLITGIPITDTVDQLISVAAQPRDLLTTRNQGLQQQQLAVNSLSSRLLSLKFDLGKLKVSTPFQSRSVTSSNTEALTATITSTGRPPLSTVSLQPVQTASSQQLISQRFESLDDIQNTGLLSFGFGGSVNEGIALDELNDGTGVSRGEIKITDLAGNSAIIDLSLARTVDEVVEAINNQSALNITASVDGDRFTLTDNVGGASNLTVLEVNGGTTAADLGLSGIVTTDATVSGADVYGLHRGLKLSRLNDGNGVRTQENLNDIKITLADGTEKELDLSAATSLGDVIDLINEDEDLAGKITAAIAGDENRLQLTDSTSGGSTFSVVDSTTGSAAADLGITTEASSGVITGERLIAGLRDTLTSSLNGGAGLGTQGSIDLTDRNGTTTNVDLSAAETLEEIVTAINNAGSTVTAAINNAGSGILLTDTSGGTGNLTIANGDANNTADVLGITVDAAQDSIDSRSLNRQTLSEATLLSTLKGGEGITASDIRITDSAGVTDLFDLNETDNVARTIGDVIDAINASAKIDVTASINETGDGILLTDGAGGDAALAVTDVNGTLAADLNLTRTSTTIDVDNVSTQVIDGTSRFAVDLSDIEGDAQAISLASLNNGDGVSSGDILITDSSGNITALVDVNGEGSSIATIGDIIDTVNARAANGGANVAASINESGTGIVLTDNATGAGNLTVVDVNGSAAADLNLLSKSTTTDTINGIGAFTAQNASAGALQTVADRINELESGVTASILNDGQGFRLQLIVDQPGAANEILLDAEGSGFAFDEISSARDALLVIGGAGDPSSGVLVSSTDNDFSSVLDGIDLSIQASSDTPVEVTVTRSDEDLIDTVRGFVESYNAIRSNLEDLTDFNSEDFTTGLLFGTNEALRVDTELSRVVTDRYFGVGNFQSLEAIGIGVDDQGQLELDTVKLQEAFADDPQSLQTFFTDESRGIAARFDAAIDSLAGAENGLLTNRNNSLQLTIDSNTQRIERFNESLDRQRETLLLQFFQLEQVIAGLQSNQTALSALQPLAPLVSTSS